MTRALPPASQPSSHFSDVLLRDLRVVEARICLVELGSGASASFAAAGHPVLHVVLEGTVWLEATEQQDPPVRLEAGETALVFYGDRHRIGISETYAVESEVRFQTQAGEEPCTVSIGQAPAKAIMMSCELELAYTAPAAQTVRAAPTIWTMLKSQRPEHGLALGGDLAQWRAELHGPGAFAFASMLASLQFAHSMRDMYRRFWSDQPMEIRAPSTRWLNAAVILLHTRPDRPWTVAGLAQAVGVSRSRFAAGFTGTIGVPPLAYLTRIRMMRAAQLLESGDIPFSEIARRSGYPVHTSFTRAFTAFHGLSPTDFVARTRPKEQGGHEPSE